MNKHILVACCSASGGTERAAREIAEAVDGELYRITPAQPYTGADLNWMDKGSRSSLEMADENCRPALAEPGKDLSGYDTVFLGFPIWWYVEPRVVDSFLEACDLSGRTVIPFATSGGSGIEKAEQRLRRQYPRVNWKAGRLLNRSGAAAWARQMIDG